MSNSVAQELMSVVKLKPKSGETPEEFSLRLAQRVNTHVGDEGWAQLSEDAQNWVNGALEANEKKEPLPKLDGVGEIEFPTEGAASSGKAAAKAGKKGKEKAPAPKPAKKGKDKASKKSSETKATSDGKRRGPKGSFEPDWKITVVKENPFRAGTKCANWFSKFKDGMTVEEAIEAGAPRHHIRWAKTLGHIKIEKPKG